MKFIVSTSALLKNLQMINGVISTNTVLPILEDFLFDIKGGKLTVFATDLETSMSSTLDVESKEDGRIAIPAKIMMDTLRNLPEQPLTFTIDSKNYWVEITSENGKYKLAGENGDDFPRIPVPEDVKKIDMPSATLMRAINQSLFAASNDELRITMTGVLFELGSDYVTFVATDAHKLVKYTRNDVSAEQATSFIVPKKALSLLKGTLSQDTQVMLSYNPSNAFFDFGSVSLICRLIDGTYPDYSTVIPTDNNNRMTIGRADLLNCLKRISIYSNKTTHQVMLKITGSELQVSAQDLDFSNEANERLNCLYDGEDMEIGFNARFLIEMLGVLESDEVKFELDGPSKAGLILPTDREDNEDILMLVMPVMLNT